MRESFPHCENISIDFAVLEKAKNVVGLATDDIGWNDVGSWNAVYELLARDGDGNAPLARRSARSEHRQLCRCARETGGAARCERSVIVDTPDALLIADRSRAQAVGEMVKMLEKQKRHDLL